MARIEPGPGKGLIRPARMEPTHPATRGEARVGETGEATQSFDDNAAARLVFGQYDQNIAHLERRLQVVINVNGNRATIKGPGDTAQQARRVLDLLYKRALAGDVPTPGDVDGAIEESAQQRSLFPAPSAGSNLAFDA